MPLGRLWRINLSTAMSTKLVSLDIQVLVIQACQPHNHLCQPSREGWDRSR